MNERRHIPRLLAVLLAFVFQAAHSQPGFHVDIKKDKPYTERKLKAEKTGDGPLKAPKRIFQNLTTHYNYYFNASNKFNEIVDRAKERHADDFSQLLSFYSFSLNATAADSAQLDSVIYKCRTGIVNHDLRMEWGDELYLLWAASWHLQKKFDSASLMLQFINYAYAPQQEYGYYSYVGSRKDGAQEMSIATKEEKKFLHSNNFSRNDAFVWQVRTLTEMENYASAGSLLATLKRDPLFPKRLTNALEEAEAYWYYKQERWDSAAAYLVKALDGAPSKKERARWEYLVAQLLERSGKAAEAATYYAKAVGSTPDPVMEVYGRLNLVRLSREGGEAAVDQNVAELLKMARRDKYEDYRDIIYYMAAQMEMERANTGAALDLLMKGARYNNGNAASRSKAFLRLADVSFDQKKYLQAAAFYDSVQTGDLETADAERVAERKPALRTVAENLGVVSRQDSLQRVAALPKAEQEDYIKKLVKRLRKEQGLKEEAAPSAGSQLAGNQPTDLFSSGKGEWYFYNTATRTQGQNEFKQLWGNRPNADNWRRFAAVSQQLVNRPPGSDPNQKNQPVETAELTAESLTAQLPLTPEAVQASNDSIRTALFNLGITYQNELEDYASAIAAFEEIRRRFPEAPRTDEVLFNLYFAYTKTGNAAGAAGAKRTLLEKFPSSRAASIVSTGKDPQAKNAVSPEATKAYEGVYGLFIEGKFNEALAAKRRADITYQTTFWQPQLLYIEAVYFVKQRQDSLARTALQTIIRQNTHPALTSKAETLLEVMSRRQQIEDELNRYRIQNGTDSTNTGIATQPAPPVKKDTAVNQTAAGKTADSLAKAAAAAARDSLAKRAAALKKEKDSADAAKALALKAAKDSAAKRALAIKAERDSLARTSKAARDSIAKVAKAERDSLAKAAVAAKRASDSLAKVEAAAKRVQDSLAKKAAARAAQLARDSVAKAQALARAERDSIAKAQARAKQVSDSLEKMAALRKSPQGYTFVPETAHAALVILDKVDPVFVNEAKNAFFRFNREKYSALPLDVQIINLTADTRMLVVNGFANVQDATDYAVRAKAVASTEIIPWLTGNKYTFSVISASNLDVLKEKQDVNVYKKFLEQNLPVKF